jgi:hypothetical protein
MNCFSDRSNSFKSDGTCTESSKLFNVAAFILIQNEKYDPNTSEKRKLDLAFIEFLPIFALNECKKLEEKK